MQRVRNVDEGMPGLRLNESPFLGLGQLHLDTPLLAENQRQATLVRVLVVDYVSQLAFERLVDELEAAIAWPIDTVAVLKATARAEPERVGQTGEHRLIGGIAGCGEPLEQLDAILEDAGKHKFLLSHLVAGHLGKMFQQESKSQNVVERLTSKTSSCSPGL